MKRLSLVVIALFSLVTLSGCLNLITVRKDFESIGFEQLAETAGMIDDVQEVFDEEGILVHATAFSDGLNYAILLEFDNARALQNELDNNEPLQLMLSAYEEFDLVEENFLLIPIAESDTIVQKMVDILHGVFVRPSPEE